MIFRLLAMEKRGWNFFFRLLVIFRQFLRSQHGFNFGLKIALKSIFCLGWPPGGLREPFWSDFGSILAAPGASPA